MLRAPTLAALAASALVLWTAAASAQTALKTVRIASGFSAPLWAGSPPGDMDRIFVVEQATGRIKIIKNGVVLGTPFINLAAKIATGSERGLLGLTFHPDYDTNGFFFVNYTKSSPDLGATIVERYQVSAGNPDVADAGSGVVMLGPILQPFSNHNGGCIQFGPDGYLYVGLGDGGSGGDPGCRAQNGLTELGKLLRIDVDNGGAAPATNPFVGDPNFLDKIWAYGLRNPWRFAFDRENGDLYIGDVGQNAREEIDWVPGTSLGGENYGWKVMEGNNCFSTSACGVVPPCNSPLFTDPVQTYTHGSGCSVTGGYVYRGCAIPDLQGTYFYADYCSNTIWSFKLVGGVVTGLQTRTAELAPGGGLSIDSITSFGETACGEMLIVDQGGEIYQILADAPDTGTDLANGLAGSNGLIPELSACGLLDTGNSAQINLRDARANAFCLLFVSTGLNPQPFRGGTLLPDITVAHFTFPLTTNVDGEIAFTAQGGGGPFDFFLQYGIDEPSLPRGAALSNALKLTWQP